MRKCFLNLVLCSSLFLTTKSFAQNIAINEDGSAANANAILDVKSFTKGILIPRVSTTGRLAMTDVKGMLVFDTTDLAFYYNLGPVVRWQRLATGISAGDPGSNWSVTGNNITGSNNFLGTVNNAPLSIRVGNQLSGLIDPNSASTLLGFNAGGNLGLQNTAFGNSALSRATGQNNTATGFKALANNQKGNFNTAVGSFAMVNDTGSSHNTSIGSHSLNQNISGLQNTSVGSFSMFQNTSGTENTAVGEIALTNNSSGSQNTAIGEGTMLANSTGSGNTAIGYRAGPIASASNLTNTTAIGQFATVSASNTIRIGNSAVTRIEGQVPFTTPSDGRFKFNVREDVKGLDFIMQLRPVTYQFDVTGFDEKLVNRTDNKENRNRVTQASYHEASAMRRTGFIAQEVERAANVSGYDFSGIIKPKTEQDHYGLSYESFVVPLVKAVQEQQQTISAQKLKTEQQDKKIADLQKQLDELKQLIQHSK
jgi:trimeric autotransporter adhesin